jgi:hypothetical protein
MRRVWIMLSVLAVVTAVAVPNALSTRRFAPNRPALTLRGNASASRLSLASCPNPDGGSCRGVLRAGTYRTVSFAPTLTYTVPTGWANYEDNLGNVNLAPPRVSLSDAQNGVNIILVWTAAQAAAMNCNGASDPNAPASAKGIAQWLAHHRGLISTQPRPVAIGGLKGYVLTVHPAPRGGIRCGGSSNVMLLNGYGNTGGQFWLGGPSDHALVYLLTFRDLPLAIIADSGGQHRPSLAADAKVIGHFHFAKS